MQLSPVQLIAACIVETKLGVSTYLETYGTTAAPVRIGAGVYEITLDAVSRSINPGNVVKVTPKSALPFTAVVDQTGDLATGPSVFTVQMFPGGGPSPADCDFYFEVTQIPSSNLP